MICQISVNKAYAYIIDHTPSPKDVLAADDGAQRCIEPREYREHGMIETRVLLSHCTSNAIVPVQLGK